MKDVTRTIKRTNKAFAEIAFEGSPLGTIADLIQHTKDDFDAPVPGGQKWGTPPGSGYAGGARVKVNKPRLRKGAKEVPLSVYEALGNKSRFSAELLHRALSWISTRD